MEKRFGTVWQAEGAFRTTTFVHQKPRGRRSARYVAMEREERVEEEDEEASDSGSENSVSSDLGS